MVVKFSHTTLTFTTMLWPVRLFNVAIIAKPLFRQFHLSYIFDAFHWLLFLCVFNFTTCLQIYNLVLVIGTFFSRPVSSCLQIYSALTTDYIILDVSELIILILHEHACLRFPRLRRVCLIHEPGIATGCQEQIERGKVYRKVYQGIQERVRVSQLVWVHEDREIEQYEHQEIEAARWD